jgi:hypothetical protein
MDQENKICLVCNNPDCCNMELFVPLVEGTDICMYHSLLNSD